MNALALALKRLASQPGPGIWVGAIVKAFDAQPDPQGGEGALLPPHYLVALWEPPAEGTAFLPRWPAVAAIAPRDGDEALMALVRHLPARARVWLTPEPVDWGLMARIVLACDGHLEPYQRAGLQALVLRCTEREAEHMLQHYSARDAGFEALKSRLLGDAATGAAASPPPAGPAPASPNLPTPLQSRREYAARMQRVLRHIDTHLDQPLELADLAALAHFSPYHFHRLFTAWVGEPLGEHLRRRLDEAARRLVLQPGVAVLDLALAAGFGSGEAFARAFKARFGHAPSAWRRLPRALRNRHQADGKADQDGFGGNGDHGAMATEEEIAAMNVKIVDRVPTPIAGLRHVGPYGEPVGRFWMEQMLPWMARHRMMAATRYGISHDDPAITEPAHCRYDAAVAVPAGFRAEAPAFSGELAGGRYAVMPFEGTSAEIGAAWARLIGQWLPQSGWQAADGPCFEHYPPGSRYEPATGRFDCELCIPIVPL